MKKCFICIDGDFIYDLNFTLINKTFPQYKFIHWDDWKEELIQEWFASNDTQTHLIYRNSRSAASSEIAGLEFESMIYLFPICQKCKGDNSDPLLATRAKASLVVARYSESFIELCSKCK